MRHWRKLAISAEDALAKMSHKDIKSMKPEDAFNHILNEVKRVAGFRERAEECAKDAAPFCHPKLATVTHQGDQDNPLKVIHGIDRVIPDPPARGQTSVFRPLLAPARYRAAHGGRGSGKSHFFAELLIEGCLLTPGTRAVCVREIQRSLIQSAKKLLEDKIQALGVGHMFEVLGDRIITPGGGVIVFQSMRISSAESIKSFENFRIAWIEEAQTLSQRSLSLLRPTIRTEGSQLWANWNPRRKSDAIDDFLRAKKPDNATVVQANWRDNPWFPTSSMRSGGLILKSIPSATRTFGKVITPGHLKERTSPSIWNRHGRTAGLATSRSIQCCR